MRHQTNHIRLSHTGPILVLLTLLAIAIAVPSAWAQNVTGEIDGTVTDSTGAIVQGATVVVTNSETHQVVRTLKTNKLGNYSATSLLPGTYSVSASAKGFSKADITAIALTVGDTLTMNLTLPPGTASETVTVTANPYSPDMETSKNATIIPTQEIRELALNTRNFEQLLLLQPGVSYGGPDELSPGMVSPSGAYNTQALSVNGLQPTQLTWLLDGADILNHSGQGQVAIFPSVDSLAQVEVIRNGYGAQYGGGGSAQVLLVSKAGGSSFHGDAYYFYRTPALNATPFLNLIANPQQPKPPMQYGDFGYSIGGPIFIPKLYPRDRSKTTFFLAQEFRRITNYPAANIGSYPYLAQANGYFANPVCLATTNSVCTKRATQVVNSPYPGFNFQVASINAVSKEYLEDIIDPALAIAQPNSLNTPQTLITEEPAPFKSAQYMGRLDHKFSQRWNGIVRYIFDPITQIVPYGLNHAQNFPGVGTSNIYTYGENILGNAVWVANASTVLDMGLAFSVNEIKVTPLGTTVAANSPDIQITTPYLNTLGVVPAISINGSSWSTPGPRRDLTHSLQGFVNITKVLGQHTVYAGVNVEHYYETVNNGSANAGAFTFTGGGSTVVVGAQTYDVSVFEQAFANFLIGDVDQFTQASIDATAHPVQNLDEAFVQDNWRASSRLTLNMGLRYSIYSQPYDSAGNLGGFQPEAYNPAQAPALSISGTLCLTNTTAACANATPNPNYNTLNGIVQAGINSVYGKAMGRTPLLNMAPRVGFAWNVFGDGKTSLRGGYGIFYNQSPFSVEQTEVSGNPAYVRNPIFNGGSFKTPDSTNAAATVVDAISGQVRNWMQPYTQSWSLDLQQTIGQNTMIDMAYSGNNTQHLQGEEDLNQPPPGLYAQAGIAGPITSGSAPIINQIRPYLGYGPIEFSDTRYFADYNSLQTSLQRRVGEHSRLVLNYTWSKAMANSRGLSTDPQNRFDLHAEWGPTNLDRRNMFVANYIYEVPFYAEQHEFMGKLLGGWELSGIVQAVDGTHLTVTTSSEDSAGQGTLAVGSNAQARVDMVGNPNNGPKTASKYFNTAAFAQVPAGEPRPADEKPGCVNGPGYDLWNTDLFKNFELPAEMRLQLRFEAFNVFNHVAFSTLATALNNTNFGNVTGTHDPREMQVGAKLYF